MILDPTAKTIRSTNGKLNIKKPPAGTGEKKDQKERKRNARTWSSCKRNLYLRYT